MKIYISGKVTGENYQEVCKQFEFFETELNDMGHEAVNPLKGISQDTDWVPAMKKALMMMMECDAILMLPFWTKSKGARIEYELAYKLGFKIYTYYDMMHLKQMQLLKS